MSAPRKRRVPLGPALDWSDDDLDRLSQVTPDDIERAADWWKEHAPAKDSGLLDAVEDDE